MSPLSSCIVTGVFPLTDGIRNTDPSYYATYLSALEFPKNDTFINVSVRNFTPPSRALFPEETFVFLVAKAALPAGEDGMLDSIHCTPFTPPPDGFLQYAPSEPTHTLIATGTVTNVDSVGSTRCFTLGVTEYVRDERRSFNVRFKYDSTSNRWKNVRLPATGSTLIAAGTFENITEDGREEPVLNLLDISYGIPETASTPVHTTGCRLAQKSSDENGEPMSSPVRTVGHRKKKTAPVDLQAPSSSPSHESPLANKSTCKGSKASNKTSGKRKRDADEVVDEDEVEVEEIAPKKSRTRKAKATKSA